MKISERIRQLRIKNNMTSKEFSKIFGISESSVSLYENGKRKPNLELIIEIANYFNVSTDYLLGITDKSGRTNSEHKLDFAKNLESVIIQLDECDNITFEGNVVDEKSKILFKKTLTNVFDTLRLFFDLQNI